MKRAKAAACPAAWAAWEWGCNFSGSAGIRGATPLFQGVPPIANTEASSFGEAFHLAWYSSNLSAGPCGKKLILCSASLPLDLTTTVIGLSACQPLPNRLELIISTNAIPLRSPALYAGPDSTTPDIVLVLKVSSRENPGSNDGLSTFIRPNPSPRPSGGIGICPPFVMKRSKSDLAS